MTDASKIRECVGQKALQALLIAADSQFTPRQARSQNEEFWDHLVPVVGEAAIDALTAAGYAIVDLNEAPDIQRELYNLREHDAATIAAAQADDGGDR